MALSSSARLHGLDLARALALFGMVIVNFEIAIGTGDSGPGFLRWLVEGLQGRAAGTFVVLAGIGASLGVSRARGGSGSDRAQVRWRLIRRAVFLFAVGVAFLMVWPADILHFYGVYLAIGALLLFAPAMAVVAFMVGCVMLSLVYLDGYDWFDRWDLVDYSYTGLWTLEGFAQNLFLNGWHPVIPWVVLYLFGVLLGRLELGDPAVRKKLLAPSSAVLALTLSLRLLLAPEGIETPGAGALAATTSIPPTPNYLLAAGSTAVIVILVAFRMVEGFPARLTGALVATGRMALTHYVAHVIVGIGILEELGALEGRSLGYAVSAAVLTFVLAVVFSALWSRRFTHGPLEAVMRRLT